MFSAQHPSKRPKQRRPAPASVPTRVSNTGMFHPAQGPQRNVTTNDMGDYINDVRTRVSDREHKVLTAVSQASGRDISDIVRGLIVDFVQAEIHRAESIAAVLRDEKGRSGTRCGNGP